MTPRSSRYGRASRMPSRSPPARWSRAHACGSAQRPAGAAAAESIDEDRVDHRIAPPRWDRPAQRGRRRSGTCPSSMRSCGRRRARTRTRRRGSPGSSVSNHRWLSSPPISRIARVRQPAPSSIRSVNRSRWPRRQCCAHDDATVRRGARSHGDSRCVKHGLLGAADDQHAVVLAVARDRAPRGSTNQAPVGLAQLDLVHAGPDAHVRSARPRPWRCIAIGCCQHGSSPHSSSAVTNRLEPRGHRDQRAALVEHSLDHAPAKIRSMVRRGVPSGGRTYCDVSMVVGRRGPVLAHLLRACAEPGGHVMSVARRVDLDAARGIDHALHPRLVADAHRMRDDVEPAVGANALDRVLGAPAEQLARLSSQNCTWWRMNVLIDDCGCGRRSGSRSPAAAGTRCRAGRASERSGSRK